MEPLELFIDFQAASQLLRSNSDKDCLIAGPDPGAVAYQPEGHFVAKHGRYVNPKGPNYAHTGY